MEEHNRTKINKKNSSNTNLKVKFDLKDNPNSTKKNLKMSNKKGKNNSIEKNSKIQLYNKMFEGEGNKKKTRNLSNHSFNENYHNDNINQKFNKTTSQLSLYKNPRNNPLNEMKTKNKILSHEKKIPQKIWFYSYCPQGDITIKDYQKIQYLNFGYIHHNYYSFPDKSLHYSF